MNDDVVIPLFAIGLPFLIVCTVMGFRFGASRREMTHRERMRALELGQPLPGGSPGAVLACAAIGAGVPIAACFAAMIASLTTRDDDLAAMIWLGAVLVALTGLYFGYRLACRLLFADKFTHSRAFETNTSQKQNIPDPDFYDVVSRRGG